MKLAKRSIRAKQVAFFAASTFFAIVSGASDDAAYWYLSRVEISAGMAFPVYDIGQAAPSAENAWGEGAANKAKMVSSFYDSTKMKDDLQVAVTIGVVNPNRRPKVFAEVPMADLEIGGETVTAVAEGWSEGDRPIEFPRDSKPKFVKFVATVPGAKAKGVLKRLSAEKEPPHLALSIENAVPFGEDGGGEAAPAQAQRPAPEPAQAAPAPADPADIAFASVQPWRERYAAAKASGESVPVETMRDAVDNGVVEAMLDLAAAYAKGVGGKPNVPEAVKLYRRAAEGGSMEGRMRYAVALLDGTGVKKADPAAAVDFLTPAAEAGNADAQFILGMCLYDGLGSGVDKDAAFRLFRKASGRSPKAATMLGYCYLNGIGTKQSNSAAFDAFRSAARRGSPDGCFWTAYCLATGTGVRERNLEAARGYAETAAGQGLAGADDLLAKIEKAMAPAAPAGE